MSKHSRFRKKQQQTPAAVSPQNAPADKDSGTHDGGALRTNTPENASDPDQTNKKAIQWGKVFERVGIIFGIGYAIVSFCMWRSMIDANNLNRKSFQMSQGAAVTIGKKDGTVADFVMPDDPKNNAGIVIYFQNGGHMPAKFNWGMVAPIVTLPPTPDFPQLESVHKFNNPLTRTRSRKAENGSFSENGEIIAGDSLYVVDVVELPQERVTRQMKAHQIFMLTGAFEYCDALGNYMCRQFTLFYQGIPYKRFSLASEFECPAYLQKIEKPDPNLDYLPPCETMSEREQNDKSHTKNK